MKTPKFLSWVILAGMLLAACTPAAQPIPATITPVPPTPVETGVPVPPAAQAVQASLAERLGVDPSEVKIREITEMQWSDTCLGLGGPAEMCGQVIVPGFRIVVEAKGQQVVFRTDRDGSTIREAVDESAAGPNADQTPIGKPVLEGELPEAVKKVVEMVSAENSLRPADVRVISAEEVMWNDSCLGVNQRGMMCMQVITPGYRVVIEAGGKQMVYHTDDAGGKIIEAGAPQPTTLAPAIIWEQTESGICTRAEIGFLVVKYGPCGGTLKQVKLSPERAKELAELADVYSSFEAGSRAGVLTFEGSGRRDPSAEEQRAIAEWARALRQSVAEGDEAVQPVFSWSREGGIAGFCDEVTISLSGWVYSSNCKNSGQEPTVFRLNEEQLQALYEWNDTYAPFTLDQSDPAGVTDGMKVKLTFNGGGQKQAAKSEQEAMMAFIGNLIGVQ